MSVTPANAELAALLLADARLPIGSHAHSAGLEPALEAGMGPEEIPRYIDARLRTIGLVEASAAVLALRTSRTAPHRLGDIQDALLARTPSSPLRTASGLLGRGLTRLAVRLWPEATAVRALTGLETTPLRPVALGVVAAVAGLDAEQVARVGLYDDTQTVAAAALKLAPVDPTDAARWVLDAGPTLETVVALAVAVTNCADLPATTAPLVERWSLDHHTRTRRIFVA